MSVSLVTKAAYPGPNLRWSKEERDKFLDEFDVEMKALVSSAAYLKALPFDTSESDTEKDAYTYFGDYARKTMALAQYWKAKSGSEVVNTATGELTIVPISTSYRGGDVTLKQIAQRLQLGPREARASLVNLGMLNGELEAKMVPMHSDAVQFKPEYSARLRLSEWAVKMAYGRRVKGGTGHGMDWITPSGLAYIERMLALPAAVRDHEVTMEPKERPKAIDVIQKLLAETPGIRQAEIVRRTGFSKMTVHRNRLVLAEKVTLASPSVI
ncbi:hypothetical protein [Rhizobium leguminosarum]